MKKIISLLLAAVMMVAAIALPVISFAEETDNFVDNADFSDDEVAVTWPNGWGHTGCADNDDEFGWEYCEEGHSADGTGCVKVFSSCHTHCSQRLLEEFVEGETYTFSCWMKVEPETECIDETSEGVGVGIGFKHDIATESPAVLVGWLQGEEYIGEGWHYIEAEYTADQSMLYWVSLEVWGFHGTVYFDEVYVGKKGSPYAPIDPVYLSDLECKSWITYHASSEMEVPDYEPWFNRQEGLNANGNEKILIGGKEYDKGIQLHASDLPDHLVDDEPSGEVVYDISEYSDKYNAFKCVFGGLTQTNDTIVSAGHTNCTEIWVDGECIYASEYIDNTSPVEIAVAIPSGAKEIRLLSKAGKEFNSEWFAWADARLERDISVKPAPVATPEPTPEPTPEATAEPTNAPTPETGDKEPTSAPEATPETSAEPAKKGCKGVVISGAAVMALALAGVCVVIRKKED